MERKFREKAALCVVMLVVLVLLYHGYQAVFFHRTGGPSGLQTSSSNDLPTATIITRPLNAASSVSPGGKPSVIVVSTWRSGSTTFAGIISSHRHAFLHYEPLVFGPDIPITNLRDPLSAPYVGNISDTYLNCRYDTIPPEELRAMYNTRPYLEKNFKLPVQCRNNRPVVESNPCLDRSYMRERCLAHPVQVIKYVRVSLAQVAPLLSRYPQLRVIWLVRDPRAVWNSRRNNDNVRSWCAAATCGNITRLCESYDVNRAVADDLRTVHPGRFLVVRFEELQADPYGVTGSVFRFLGLDRGPEVLDKVAALTQRTNFTTKRDWHDHLTERQRNAVQKNCRESMVDLQYEFL